VSDVLWVSAGACCCQSEAQAAAMHLQWLSSAIVAAAHAELSTALGMCLLPCEPIAFEVH
jgi:membrane protein implicated in regulation of membrane protease activity